LAAIAGVFGEAGVSIASVWQEGRGDEATLILITHAGPEAAHQIAVEHLLALDVVKQIAATIRVLLPET
ncbi:MAG: homoserine dehydrogenase, partial [Acidimicrobiia bacterium]